MSFQPAISKNKQPCHLDVERSEDGETLRLPENFDALNRNIPAICTSTAFFRKAPRKGGSG